jgi:hypothetical protein
MNRWRNEVGGTVLSVLASQDEKRDSKVLCFAHISVCVCASNKENILKPFCTPLNLDFSRCYIKPRQTFENKYPKDHQDVRLSLCLTTL